MQRKMTLHLPDLKATLHSGQKAALHSGQREALHWGQRVALLGSLAHHSWAEARLRGLSCRDWEGQWMRLGSASDRPNILNQEHRLTHRSIGS